MQQGPDNTTARAGGGGFIGTLDRIWSRVVESLAVLGTVMIGGLMLIICADIVFRNLLGSSLPLVSELGGLLLVMIVYLQLAATIRAERLARTDIFLPLLGGRLLPLRRLLVAAFNLVGAFVIGLIAWSTLGILEKDLASGEFIGIPGIATLQTWPFRMLILVGVAVSAVEFLLRALAAFRPSPELDPDR